MTNPVTATVTSSDAGSTTEVSTVTTSDVMSASFDSKAILLTLA